ncbi:MAG TPA: hypothetical protein VML75_03335 [Kofleriaceae bacterium]|nr:hypothetical protein [Kofleriaceae bacterium]
MLRNLLEEAASVGRIVEPRGERVQAGDRVDDDGVCAVVVAEVRQDLSAEESHERVGVLCQGRIEELERTSALAARRGGVTLGEARNREQGERGCLTAAIASEGRQREACVPLGCA